MCKSRSQDIKPFRGGEREVGIPWGGGIPGGRGALKRSLGRGLLPRPSNPTPFHFVIVFKTKQFFLKLRSWRWNFLNKNLLVRQKQASFELAVIRELKRRRFWATHVNRKWGLLPFYMPGHYQICIAEFLFSYKDDLPKGFNQTTAQCCEKSTSGWRPSLKNAVA